ncbi:MAG: N-acetyl sugar amidotransferase [Glaciecola sp.]
MTKLQICTRTVMDTTDPSITFNEKGECNYCDYFDNQVKPNWHPGTEEGARLLEKLVADVKESSKGNEYDCIIGLSGGVDSSYLAMKVVELGLKPLAIHVDSGWNSELAVHNIENIVKNLGIDLFTYVVDWKEIRDLQYAYFKSGVMNLDVPQDHLFTAILYQQAKQHNVKYFLSGSNIATESILPEAWGYDALDAVNMKAIQKQFGKLKKFKSYKFLSFYDCYVKYPRIFGLRKAAPLDYMVYEREAAKEAIIEKLNWRDYGAKHHESKFTKFFQAHYLPHKFGVDKRKAHLTSMILSGQISREDAFKELEEPLYNPNELREDKEFVAKKLGFSQPEFDALLDGECVDYSHYKNQKWLFDLKSKIAKIIRGN